MLSPIARSAQRISVRNWAHNPPSNICLRVDAPCINRKHFCSLTLSRKLTTTVRNVSSVAVESKKIAVDLESRFTCAVALEEINTDVQESNKIQVYHQLPINSPAPDIERQSKWAQTKKQKAMQKFKVAEERLAKTDPVACKMFQAIKAPMLELERYRASALIDIKACRTLISQIGDIQNPSTAIVIGNPGAGILSTELVRQGAKQLMLFECNPEIRSTLQKLHKNDPVVISDQYLFGSVWRCQDNKHYLNRLLESDKCTHVKIIHSLTNPCQTRDLLTNYTSGQVPYDEKNVEIYLVAQKDFGEKLASLEEKEPQQRIKFSSSWRTFIKTELVCTLPADSFFPVFAPLGFGIKGNSKKDPNVAVLRCTFRPIQCVGRPLTAEERYMYDLFIRHVMSSPSGKVAHTLEKWTPGIGIRLIRQGIPLFTRFSQLSKQEFERVFFTFLEFAPTNNPVWLMMGCHHTKQAESM